MSMPFQVFRILKLEYWGVQKRAKERMERSMACPMPGGRFEGSVDGTA